MTVIETGKKTKTFAPDYDPKRLDAIAYLPKARARARSLLDDVFLYELDVEGVFPSGKANLSLSSDFRANYYFRSPSRSKRPKDAPRGLVVERECLVYVELSAKGGEVWVVSDEECKRKRRPSPRCSLA